MNLKEKEETGSQIIAIRALSNLFTQFWVY